MKEVIQSDFQKPVPGLDSTGVAAQGERQKVENKPSSVKRPSSSYPVANSSSNSDSSKNGVSGGGQVRLVTDPVTGRSRLEIVPDE